MGRLIVLHFVRVNEKLRTTVENVIISQSFVQISRVKAVKIYFDDADSIDMADLEKFESRDVAKYVFCLN